MGCFTHLFLEHIKNDLRNWQPHVRHGGFQKCLNHSKNRTVAQPDSAGSRVNARETARVAVGIIFAISKAA
jgi:hypothetical protein